MGSINKSIDETFKLMYDQDNPNNINKDLYKIIENFLTGKLKLGKEKNLSIYTCQCIYVNDLPEFGLCRYPQIAVLRSTSCCSLRTCTGRL